jgi:hypothetical protein
MFGGSGKNRDIGCAPFVNGEYVPCAHAEIGGDADEHMFGAYVPKGFFQVYEKDPEDEAYTYDNSASESYLQDQAGGALQRHKMQM